MIKLKAIFLDIDGVLNNECFLVMLRDRMLGKEQYFQLFKDLGMECDEKEWHRLEYKISEVLGSDNQ